MEKGNHFICGNTFGKIRAMINDSGNNIEFATPSTPVEILGMNESAFAGDDFIKKAYTEAIKESKSLKTKIKLLEKPRESVLKPSPKKTTIITPQSKKVTLKTTTTIPQTMPLTTETPERLKMKQFSTLKPKMKTMEKIQTKTLIKSKVKSPTKSKVKIDRATVYRTLDSLEELNLITHAHRPHDSGYYFINKDNLNKHIICKSCNKIVDIPKKSQETILKNIRNETGFKSIDSNYIIRGFCKNCK